MLVDHRRLFRAIDPVSSWRIRPRRHETISANVQPEEEICGRRWDRQSTVAFEPSDLYRKPIPQTRPWRLRADAAVSPTSRQDLVRRNRAVLESQGTSHPATRCPERDREQAVPRRLSSERVGCSRWNTARGPTRQRHPRHVSRLPDASSRSVRCKGDRPMGEQ